MNCNFAIQRSSQFFNSQYKIVFCHPTLSQNSSQSPTSAKYDLGPPFKIILLPHKAIWPFFIKNPLHSEHMVQRSMGGHFCDWINEWKVKVVQRLIIVSVNRETLGLSSG